MDNWKFNHNRAAVHRRSKDEPSVFLYVQGMGWPGFLSQGFWFVFSSPSLPSPLVKALLLLGKGDHRK